MYDILKFKNKFFNKNLDLYFKIVSIKISFDHL